jgi:hypothetical protein
MQIHEYLITYEVFDKGCVVMRYYDQNDNVLHKKFYLYRRCYLFQCQYNDI